MRSEDEEVEGMMVEGTRDSGEVEMETRRPRWEGVERRVEKAVMRSEEAEEGG